MDKIKEHLTLVSVIENLHRAGFDHIYRTEEGFRIFRKEEEFVILDCSTKTLKYAGIFMNSCD